MQHVDSLKNLHPFPARMAPNLALDKIQQLSKPGDLILDPMCGSGTVPRLARLLGRNAVACDLDPLAVMMTRTACHPIWTKDLTIRANEVVRAASKLDSSLPCWIGEDEQTREFANFWFADRQREDLSRIARILQHMPRSADPLRVALSRTIVTKIGGASLARDTSHSRPHRVADENDSDVFDLFVKSALKIERIQDDAMIRGETSIRKADARLLRHVSSLSVDLTVTSPPYLNAIDYIRGHRLALVWLGWTMTQLRNVRATSIGSEKFLRNIPHSIRAIAAEAVPRMSELPQKDQRLILRYAKDMDRLCGSLATVTKPRGHLVLVVADSILKGIIVSTSSLVISAAGSRGFILKEDLSRPLPMQHRYLPPPERGTSTFSARMKTERVMTFERIMP